MAVPISNLTATWANSEITYTGIGMDINADSYDANSALIDLKLNSNSKIKVTSNGVLYINGAPISSSSGSGEAYDKANSANIIAVAAFAAANAANGGSIVTAYNKANDANLLASTAYDKANAANILAYNTGIGVNTFLLSVIAGANSNVGVGANTVGSAAYDKANSANVLAFNTGIGANAWSNNIGTVVNTYIISIISGANSNVGIGANTVGSAAYDKANSANIIAVAAFNAANSSGGPAIGAAYDKANSANIIAVAAFNAANAANAGVVADAYNKANNALANTSGVTFGGYLTLTGNVGIGTSNAMTGLVVEDKGIVLGGDGSFGTYFGNTVAASLVRTNLVVVGNEHLFTSRLGNDARLNLSIAGFSSATPRIRVYKSTGSVGAHGAVTLSSSIFQFQIWGSDGSAYQSGTSFVGVVDGAVSSGVVPMAFVIYTGTSGGGQEKFRVTSNGRVGIGTSAPSANLHVIGTANISSNLSVSNIDVINKIDAVGTAANTNAANASYMNTGTINVSVMGSGANSDTAFFGNNTWRVPITGVTIDTSGSGTYVGDITAAVRANGLLVLTKTLTSAPGGGGP